MTTTPTTPQQAGALTVEAIQSKILDWVALTPGPGAFDVWLEIERTLSTVLATAATDSAARAETGPVPLPERTRKAMGASFLAATAMPAPEPAATDSEEDAHVIKRLSGILADVALALMGDELPDDRAEILEKLPKVAQVLKFELELYRSGAADTPAPSNLVDAADRRGDLQEQALVAAGQWANANTPIKEALAYRNGFVAGAASPQPAAPATAAHAGAMPKGFNVKRIEGTGWIVESPSGTRWVAHEETPIGELMQALAAPTPVAAHAGASEEAAFKEWATARNMMDTRHNQLVFHHGFVAGQRAAQPASVDAVPVAWHITNRATSFQYTAYSEEMRDLYIADGFSAAPLYTAPPASTSADVKDVKDVDSRGHCAARAAGEDCNCAESCLRWVPAAEAQAPVATKGFAGCKECPDELECAWHQCCIRKVYEAADAQAPVDFPYQRTFNAIAAATEIAGGNISISVRKFQEAYNAAPAQPAVVPVAVEAAQHHKLDTGDAVFFYEQDFYVLSNFSSFRVLWKDIDFDTSEAAYHWEKFPNTPGVRAAIQGAGSAHSAFKVAERFKASRRPNWDAVKVEIMRGILRAKVRQHEYVGRKLLATGERTLIEDSWRDDFWGWGPRHDGKNMLGKLWMEVRAELRASAPAAAQEGVRP